MAATFCAVCTSEVGPFTLEPFGRAGAMVNVCHDCATVHPITGRYSFGERDGAGAPNTASHYSGRNGEGGRRRHPRGI